MKQKIYQVDAFTAEVFGGNPAAVCPMDKWLSDNCYKKLLWKITWQKQLIM